MDVAKILDFSLCHKNDSADSDHALESATPGFGNFIATSKRRFKVGIFIIL